jgi:non-ribosomal peptide synthetase component F
LLARSGIGPDDIVGICLEPSTPFIVALLGVLKAGAAWLPLDPRHPAPRLAALCEDAHLRAVVTREGLAGCLPDAVPAIVLDSADVTHALASLPGKPLDASERVRSLHPDCLAYVIYTSGSSGRPKGVGVSHAAACASLRARRAALGCSGPADTGSHRLHGPAAPATVG